MADTTHIARPYAKAIFDFAIEEKQLAEWHGFLSLAANIAKHEDVVRLLGNPLVTTDNKIEFFKSCCEQASESQLAVLQLLGHNNRFILLPEIDELFSQYKAEHEKSLEIRIDSAIELTDAQQQQIQAALVKRLQREVSLNLQTDEHLIGGAIIRMGDRVIDGSILGKLKRLRAALQSRSLGE